MHLITTIKLKSNFTRHIGCRVLAVKCSKNDHLIILGRMYQTAHQNDGFNAFRLCCCSELNPACLCCDSKPGTMSDSTSQPSSRAAKSSKFMSLSRAIKHSDIHLEVLSLQSRKSFEYLLCYHRMVVISPKDLEGFKADIVFIYMMLACWLSI